MAAAKKQTKSAFTKDELVYMAGFYEATLNIRGTNSVQPVAVSKTDAYPNYLAKTYGGSVAKFVANSGKDFYGWFLPLEGRLAILAALEEAKVLPTLSPFDCDAIRGKLERSAAKS